MPLTLRRTTREDQQRMLLVDTVTLVNLVSETRDIPEFIGKNCKPEAIAKAVLDVLEAPDRQAPPAQQELRGPPALRALRARSARRALPAKALPDRRAALGRQGPRDQQGAAVP